MKGGSSLLAAPIDNGSLGGIWPGSAIFNAATFGWAFGSGAAALGLTSGSGTVAPTLVSDSGVGLSVAMSGSPKP